MSDIRDTAQNNIADSVAGGSARDSAGGSVIEGSTADTREKFLARQVSAPWVITITLITVVLAGFLIWLLVVSKPQQSTLEGSSIEGRPAPTIVASTLDGGTFNLDHHRGKWVVVNFFATWCPGCLEEVPELEEFQKRHPDSEAQVVTVVFNDIRRNVEDSPMGSVPWPVVFGEQRDETGKIAVDYGVLALPETFVVAPNGVVVKKLIGAAGVTADRLDAVIAAATAPSASPAPATP